MYEREGKTLRQSKERPSSDREAFPLLLLLISHSFMRDVEFGWFGEEVDSDGAAIAACARQVAIGGVDALRHADILEAHLRRHEPPVAQGDASRIILRTAQRVK